MIRIESTKNEKVKNWKKLLTKKERDKTNLFMVEGIHLVEEAIKHHATIKELILTESFIQAPIIKALNAPMYVVTEEIIKLISDTITPQGVIAICEKLSSTHQINEHSAVLLLDNVQDPGNIGTIIRTADSVGADLVVLGEGCADLYNNKVIRSTQGSIFHLPIIKGSLEEWIKRCQENGVPIYGTDLHNGERFDHMEYNKKSGFALMVGNEGSGIDEKFLRMTDKNVYIPIFGAAESLNVGVATGILLYHFKLNQVMGCN